MINHKLHYWKDGFSLSWEIELSFRLNNGDIIHNELLERIETECDWQINDMYQSSRIYSHFEVEKIEIDEDSIVNVFMKKPIESTKKENYHKIKYIPENKTIRSAREIMEEVCNTSMFHPYQDLTIIHAMELYADQFKKS